MTIELKIYAIIFVTVIFCFVCFSFAQDQKPGREAIEYTAESLRDPFQSWLPGEILVTEQTKVGGAEIKLPELSLQGISLHVSRPTAIINNQVVKVGDTINEAKIVEINREGVSLIYQGQIFNIPSPSSIIRGQN